MVLLLRSALFIVAVCLATHAVAADRISTTITVIAIGDSLVSGYGVQTDANFASVLEQRLIDAGYAATVFDAGWQHTSQSGAYFVEHPYSRVEGREVDLLSPNSVAIVEVGGNDCLAGMALAETKANLDRIMTKLSGLQVPVLVVGTAAFDACGKEYAAEFEQLFVAVAERFGALLYPEFKAGLLGHPELFLPDLDHPNEAGVTVAVDNILPAVEQLIARL